MRELRVPSSVSEADPVSVSVLPLANVELLAGAVIVTDGFAFVVVVPPLGYSFSTPATSSLSRLRQEVEHQPIVGYMVAVLTLVFWSEVPDVCPM